MATQRGEDDRRTGTGTGTGTGIGERWELLWRVRERPRRGPRPKLSLDGVVAAAVGVADAEGLDAVSMQRVAAEFGFTTMSLYRYVPSKERLVELMADSALGAPPDLGCAGDWRDRLELLVGELAALYRRRPWLLRMEVSGPPAAPMQLAWFESYLDSLAGSGLPGRERVSVVMFIDGAVRELARVAVQMEQARKHSGESDEAAGAAHARVLRRFAVPERFPNVAALVAEGIFDPAPPDGAVTADAGAGDELVDGVGTDIVFGLHRLLDGVDAHVRERTRAGSG